MKNKKINYIISLMFLTFLFVSFLWAIDIGASAMIIGGEAQGLLFTRSGNSQYHIGLIGAGMVFLISVIVNVYLILNGKK